MMYGYIRVQAVPTIDQSTDQQLTNQPTNRTQTVPEITVRKVNPRDAFVVIASDGVFEFLTNQVRPSVFLPSR